MRAHLAEFIGTFALVFFGCGAIANGLPPVAVSLVFGLAIAVMIYALGHISGAHFNPAVSVGFAVGRHFPWPRVATYAAVQIAGAIAGALLLRLTLGPEADVGVTRPSGPIVQALVWEAFLTFFLMLVITAVATDIRAVGEAAAIAIGGAVALAALVGGPISGASMNPARSLGPALVSGDLEAVAIYFIGPIVGAIAAAVVYQLLRRPPAGMRALASAAEEGAASYATRGRLQGDAASNEFARWRELPPQLHPIEPALLPRDVWRLLHRLRLRYIREAGPRHPCSGSR